MATYREDIETSLASGGHVRAHDTKDPESLQEHQAAKILSEVRETIGNPSLSRSEALRMVRGVVAQRLWIVLDMPPGDAPFRTIGHWVSEREAEEWIQNVGHDLYDPWVQEVEVRDHL